MFHRSRGRERVGEESQAFDLMGKCDARRGKGRARGGNAFRARAPKQGARGGGGTGEDGTGRFVLSFGKIANHTAALLLLAGWLCTHTLPLPRAIDDTHHLFDHNEFLCLDL